MIRHSSAHSAVAGTWIWFPRTHIRKPSSEAQACNALWGSRDGRIPGICTCTCTHTQHPLFSSGTDFLTHLKDTVCKGQMNYIKVCWKEAAIVQDITQREVSISALIKPEFRKFMNLGKEGWRDVKIRAWGAFQCCEMLSPGHDMVVTHMISQQLWSLV